jgi:hypothetical protein
MVALFYIALVFSCQFFVFYFYFFLRVETGLRGCLVYTSLRSVYTL